MIAGLLLILAGQSFKYEVFKVRLDSQIANIGALFIFVGVMQWLISSAERRALVAEIVDGIGGNKMLHTHGIVGSSLNTKLILDLDEWEKSSELIIGVHYDARFLTDRSELIAKRILAKRVTTIMHVNPESKAAEYLRDSKSGISDIADSVRKLRQIAKEHFHDSPFLTLQEMNRVLRYTFTYCETSIWVRFITNSAGHVAGVPAVKIAAGTPLYDFFKADIKRIS